MKSVIAVLGMWVGLVASAAEIELASSKFELSCSHRKPGGELVAIHADIVFDGKTNTCEATKGRHIEYMINYDIPFKCEKPVPVSMTKENPIQLWVLSSPDNKDKISKLALLFNHDKQTGSGFALAENGLAYPVDCKKW